ncbi:DUF2442 domain-containing protein [Neorhizobium galegae]|nr:DUF2442 domain-containing protein [Neorhizobium galegae]CDZ30463.1 Hypothetical protein NGAL_HAMBI490_53320 [Neorhizobium galegae bv. officinalis]MCM2497358.1 DUF2442 domain-containing protein [Neorhizobium galegae]MCQ1771448.1 DUF2442 domain-containing protein [Neorhizobium galegae]MCQ1778466.1 DUF2442 domain-containing protein [Neorhizobium galegae]MCQ1794957.1 DUF2442 domain-containing protein [Neorhizobium galegae]
MKDREIVTVGGPLPRIVDAELLDGRKVRIVWEDGETKVVDLAPALESRRIYIPLRHDDELFRQMRVSEYRNALEWPGEDLEFSAVWLAALPSITFDNGDFRNAMDELGMTLDGMASALEISRRLVADYRKNKPIPRHVALATRYLVEHQGKA